MNTATDSSRKAQDDSLELATFYVADLCLALEIGQIQEIIRDVQVTRVPHAPQEISGVFNLRGEVTTMIDLRRLLGLPPAAPGASTRTLIVRSEGESIGLVVDRVADIHTVAAHRVLPTPSNVGSIEGRFFRGVYPGKSEFIVVFDLDAALSTLPSEPSESA